jgi:uncharacterized protein (TIGR02145 family)
LGPPNTNNQTTAPTIKSILPGSANIGDNISITGSGFGLTQNGSYVTFNSTTATQIGFWSDSIIVAQVPNGATSGNVYVTVNNKQSLGSKITIQSICQERDSYTSVTIGTQVWMGQNLDVCYYRNGDLIPEVTDSAEWASLTTGAWCYYNNDPTLGLIYGKLYNWYAVTDPRGLAPAGWHVASDSEWTILSNFCGGISGAGSELKEMGNVHWQSPNTGAKDDVGFTALPGGRRDIHGNFVYLGMFGSWWSTTVDPNNKIDNAWWISLDYSSAFFTNSSNFKMFGASVRCVHD